MSETLSPVKHRRLRVWFFRPTRISILFVWSLVICGIMIAGWRAIVAYQTPGPFDENNMGFCDFHNGIYFPASAWLAGDNPYSADYVTRYPVMREVPLYSPLVFLAHSPLALLPLHFAEAVYFLLIILSLLCCVWLIYLDAMPAIARHLQYLPDQGKATVSTGWFWVGLLLAVAVYSRPGHVTLFTGYFTIELSLATLAVIFNAQRRPWIASLALAYTSIKPTYIIPLAILLMACGYFKTALRGITIALILGSLCALWIAVHDNHNKLDSNLNDSNSTLGDSSPQDLGTYEGLQDLVTTFQHSQTIHREQNWEKPAVSWTRMDLLAIIAKWLKREPDDIAHLLAMVVILTPISFVLWLVQNRRESQAGFPDGLLGPEAAFVIVALFTCLYRQAYDALPLLGPVLGLILATPSWPRHHWIRWILTALLAIPLVNYLSTLMVLKRLQLSPIATNFVTSLNGIALAAALVILGFVILGQRGDDKVAKIT